MNRMRAISERFSGFIKNKTVLLKETVSFTEEFVKHELEGHLDASVNGCSEGVHFCLFSLDGSCENEHVFECLRCVTADLVERKLSFIVDKFIHFCLKNAVFELSTMKETARRIQFLIFKFVAHIALGKWQDSRLRKRLLQVWLNHRTGNNSTLVLDFYYKRKMLPLHYRKSQRAEFGEARNGNYSGRKIREANIQVVF